MVYLRYNSLYYFIDLITGLCQMCRESMVRASLRVLPTGFNTMLSLLSNKKTKHFYPEILDAITQFNYDHVSLMVIIIKPVTIKKSISIRNLNKLY